MHQENREQTKLLTFFEDIDADGAKEKFDITNYRDKFAACLYKKNETALVHQFNFYGNVPIQEGINTPIFNDINNNSALSFDTFLYVLNSLICSA